MDRITIENAEIKPTEVFVDLEPRTATLTTRRFEVVKVWQTPKAVGRFLANTPYVQCRRGNQLVDIRMDRLLSPALYKREASEPAAQA